MIPILYEKDETAFASNGLGRLRDCISCVVTEERNGIYECDFEYPLTGAHYDEIQVGRIIGVTHDESGDIQPFDIVSYTKPIDGIVTFHCTHVSYRLSYVTKVTYNVNSLAEAFAIFEAVMPDGYPFTFWTDKDSTGYLGCSDEIPKSIRSVLGGVQGSILDSYGGEYEWDKWTVKLWSARGQVRDFTIRYGVNMLDYNEELSIEGTFSSCFPYWTDGTIVYTIGTVDSNGSTITGRKESVPLDLSDKFESQPSESELRQAAIAYMNGNNTFLPSQNIHVEFARLQDIGYEGFESLLECNLCDTITVVFPDYNGSAQYKIVKTTWDVLRDRYESMELGDLSVTLAEALGVSSGGSGQQSRVPTCTVITLPYTPAENGLILAMLRANTTGRAYVIYSNTSPVIIDAYQTAGGYFNGVLFATSGQQIAETASVNVSDKAYYFVSL